MEFQPQEKPKTDPTFIIYAQKEIAKNNGKTISAKKEQP